MTHRFSDEPKKKGIERWTNGAIDSASLADVSGYQAVAARGLAELKTLLCPSGKC